MKKLSVFIVITMLILPTFSQAGDMGVGIGLNVGVSRLEGDLRNPQLSPLVSGHLKILPIPYVAIGGEVGFSSLNSKSHPVYSDFRTLIVPFEMSLTFNFLPLKKINPYVMAGGGGVYWNAQSNGNTIVLAGKKQSKVDSFLKTGGGLEYRLNNSVSLDLGATFRFSLTDAFDQLFQGDENDQVVDVHAGITYYFKLRKNDHDNDGVPDELDLSPEIAEDHDGFKDHDGIPEKNPSPVVFSSLDQSLAPDNSFSTPVVIHHLITTAESGKDVNIKANVYSRKNLRVVATLYRIKGTTRWQVIRMNHFGDSIFQATIPGNEVTRDGLEYCVVAVDETLKGIGYSGLPSLPIQMKVFPDGKPWRILGGTIGAATLSTATYLILRKQK